MTSIQAVETSRPNTIPRPSQQLVERGYGSSSVPYVAGDTALADRNPTDGNAAELSPLSQTASNQNYGKFNEEWDASQRGSSILDGDRTQLYHTPSIMLQGDHLLPRRGGTLKKKASLRRSGSRRSSRAGSVRSLALQPEPSDEMHSAFYSPVPTTGNPTELLANRFTAWRKLLKDLIAYFREIQNGYDHRGKNSLKISNVANNIAAPTNFLQSGGINDAMQILRDYHKQAVLEANKAKMIEEDVIQALAGLRSDLQQKIKEIKNLSGDFKNSVDKEMDATRKAVRALGDALGQSDIDASQMTGKQDPYLLRLAVDRQLEKQIDEENYLHQAYLNLETSGRELEAIIVGEIQKAYNAYTGILKREADEAYNAIENLRTGPIAMPKDYEWNNFIETDEHFVDPRVPVRRVENIHYPGRDHELAQEVRAGLLERKSKYLKSYTAGWYVLSPTHLHEFKTADKSQTPIMSLYLPEQKLGSHSSEGGSSNKFMLKGRQTGSMHRGHSWVFRAESYDTMMAWYEDIKSLTESAPQERNAFVRSHARSLSGTSQRAASLSSDGVMDEEDEEPFSTSATSAVVQTPNKQEGVKRPEPGGRFPSDIQVDPARGLQVPISPSSAGSSIENNEDRDAITAAAYLPGSRIDRHCSEARIESRRSASYGHQEWNERQQPHGIQLDRYAAEDGLNPYTYQPLENHDFLAPGSVFAESTSNVERAKLAMEESSKVAAPDMDESSYERVAQQGAGSIAVDDAYLPKDLRPATPGTIRTNVSPQSTFATAKPGGIVGSVLGTATAANHDQLISEKTTETEQGIEYSAPQILGPIMGSSGKIRRSPSFLESLQGGHHHGSSSDGMRMHVPGEFPQ